MPSSPAPVRTARRSRRVPVLTVGLVALASAAVAAPSASAAQSFVSRPDLKPTKISVTTKAQDTAPGLIFTAPKNGGVQRGSMIFDDAGSLVWFRAAAKGKSVIDTRRAILDGKPVITFWEGNGLRGYGYGETVILDTAYNEIARVSPDGKKQMDFHEFTVTPRNTALLISYKPVRGSTAGMKGGSRNDLIMRNLIQEVDIKTNKVLWEWDATKAVSPKESYLPLPARPEVAYDFIHANSVTEDTDGNILVSSRHTHTIYKVNKKTKKITWKLGGKKSTFKMGKGARFAWQHDAQRREDGTISLFDNASADLADLKKRGIESRGLKLKLDEKKKTASVAREYENPKPQLNNTQGNMQGLTNGNEFVGWGGVGNNVSEFSAGGKQLFEAKYEKRLTESYRAYRYEWSGQPTSPPKAVARKGGAGTQVWVSWNGATTVATWRVLGGASAETLQPRQDIGRQGFETTGSYAAADQVVAVQALDASGAVLSQSKPVPVAATR
ncbi:arylsulfotransferase family protein [Patulibacter americanus]|uniref:arylsulfotransferase family protein n=1 Tax=Patulibacter americanus TaxID=588672 RepID=UPI0003B48899|nr:arylsulfotransferase family protein [Patulibacter americanus]